MTFTRVKLYAAAALIMMFLASSCATVPVTGRQQLSLIPAQTMLSMSYQEYNDFLKKHELSTDQEQTALVKKAGGRIQKALEQYFTEKRMTSKLKEYQWEFNLVKDEAANAWCMPGGKVVVYTGILPYTKDENGLAVVMGHEIAHAVANHGGERMSQMLAVQLGGMTLAMALEQKSQETKQLWMAAFGLGSQLGVLLPYSRLHENEADHLGLLFMAMAGYDPGGAVTFWERMSQKEGKKAPPEFLSTHPSDATRIAKIKKLIPEVMPYYQEAKN
jgi:predicted Zn-dependent protease